jgi:hypothetical protein
VGQLPYGLQKRVDLGRALAMEPQVLLLDEPMAGMNVEEKQDMCRFILDVNDEFGTTIVLIEHDMGVVMDISDRVVVLDYGKKIGDGTPDEVRNNEDVISAYLGTERPYEATEGGLGAPSAGPAPSSWNMAFFLETLIGGLMAGMLYSLVALGFVLIYKASGVFNFAQGAMVLFAAWPWRGLPNGFPKWTGITSRLVANLLAFVIAGLSCWRGLGHRAPGAAPPGQPGRHHAADGHAGHHLLSGGLGQTMFGSDIYKIDVGMPKDPVIPWNQMFEGGILINKEDLYAAALPPCWWRC